MAGIKIVLGAGVFWLYTNWTAEGVEEFLSTFVAGGIKEIDTAQVYGESELILGTNDASKRFDISTKLPGKYVPGSLSKDEVLTRTKASLETLKLRQLDILYLHAPDPSVPIEDTLAGVQTLYTEGAFRRFGLSNYTTEDVRKIHEHQKRKGWVLPTVYQGNYNPVARNYENDLIPTLRQLNIAFYAYSPAAGGFLAKSKEQVLDGSGRFSMTTANIGQMYNSLYNKASLLKGLETWHEIARDAGCSPYNLAIRWVTFNSALKPEHNDAIIIGPRDLEQSKETFVGLGQGPLSPEISQRINALWDTVRHEAPSAE
ncbi:hypothetical protein LCI18_012694 [Fusarium solani-melongenae]|uniref:Uncharacterized protein n=1 Tax=Fusarium solani subsp. cucurbitae TaxID=2747967 RepID=A0ACD3ZKD4_FUSSC|nr:hypothetical protein LCI18_012694 [Fusarium solani-melongenae]